MNEQQMSILASDRRRDLVAEADRARLARGVRRSPERRPAEPVRRRGGLRLDLGALFGRPSA
jgi:hypothetical protein